ncbi:hypothetical protein EGR_01575 [Echinococcus granulosus]|uniref:Uncharacterized protein n=1 Tax=Echinococcus granulosus TaxID=6210 RepID=W6UQK8_ECHGR|nr:hypothetical protein EGR_01575 [Echinococcus granulosus]EUB63493.1 hypothetical protein EGR_01575 [Echinococcus granulosus]
MNDDNLGRGVTKARVPHLLIEFQILEVDSRNSCEMQHSTSFERDEWGKTLKRRNQLETEKWCSMHLLMLEVMFETGIRSLTPVSQQIITFPYTTIIFFRCIMNNRNKGPHDILPIMHFVSKSLAIRLNVSLEAEYKVIVCSYFLCLMHEIITLTYADREKLWVQFTARIMIRMEIVQAKYSNKLLPQEVKRQGSLRGRFLKHERVLHFHRPQITFNSTFTVPQWITALPNQHASNKHIENWEIQKRNLEVGIVLRTRQTFWLIAMEGIFGCILQNEGVIVILTTLKFKKLSEPGISLVKNNDQVVLLQNKLISQIFTANNCNIAHERRKLAEIYCKYYNPKCQIQCLLLEVIHAGLLSKISF